MSISNEAPNRTQRIVIAGLGSSFLVGVIFWAGATYSRITSMEEHINSIDSKLSTLGDVTSYARRIQALEDRVAQHSEQLSEHEFYLKSDTPMPKRRP